MLPHPSSRDPFTTYIDGAAEASRYEGSNDHEGENKLDRNGYGSHPGFFLGLDTTDVKITVSQVMKCRVDFHYAFTVELNDAYGITAR
jgi:hypothetical protein